MLSQTITGEIRDSKNQLLPYANVYLKSENGSIAAYCYADNNAKYELKTNKIGKYTLNFSALNYQTYNVDIEITPESDILTVNALLTYAPIELKEVVLRSEKQINQKKDTIVFNAKSFATGNEKVVEDLLKKIPGLTVTNDGTIKVGNQEVEKIMIDGDDFFEKGYKLLTKNMPSAPIEKVELYQHYSNKKYLKNIEHSDKVALNLKLSEEAKRQWLGDIQAGYGVASENRHEIHGNLMNFGKKNKYYFITNVNNVGRDAIGDINHLIKPSKNNESSSVGDNENAMPVIAINDSKPELKEQRVNFNNAQMVSLNSIFTISEKAKLKTLFFVNNDRNHSYINGFESFIVHDIDFQNTAYTHAAKSNTAGFGKIDFTYDFSNSKMLEYSGRFNLSNQKNNRDVIFNNNFLDEKLHGKGQLFDQKVVFSNKLSDSKVLLLTGRFINEEMNQSYTTEPFLYPEIFMTEAQYSQQTALNKMQFAAVESHFLNRMKNKNVLEVQFGNQFRKDHLDTEFFLGNGNFFPNEYQNRFLYQTNDLYLNLKYRFTFKKVGLSTQFGAHQMLNKLENFDVSETQSPFFIKPKVAIDWNINKSNKVSATYAYAKTNATVLDNFTNYINTGFRSFQKGTNEFNQLANSSMNITHNFGDWSKRFFVNNYITYVKNHDFISTNSYVSKNFSQNEKILIHNRNFLSLSSNIEKYIKSFKTNLKVSIEGSQSNYKNSINGSGLREVKDTNLDYGITLRSGFRGFFNYHFGFTNTYNSIKTTIKNDYTNNVTFLDLHFMISKKIDFQIQTERYYFGSMEKQNNAYHFVDFEAKYTLKQKNIVLSLLGSNLTDTKKFKDYNITDISVSKTEYRLQPRYVLLKIDFQF